MYLGCGQKYDILSELDTALSRMGQRQKSGMATPSTQLRMHDNELPARKHAIEVLNLCLKPVITARCTPLALSPSFWYSLMSSASDTNQTGSTPSFLTGDAGRSVIPTTWLTTAIAPSDNMKAAQDTRNELARARYPGRGGGEITHGLT